MIVFMQFHPYNWSYSLSILNTEKKYEINIAYVQCHIVLSGILYSY